MRIMSCRTDDLWGVVNHSYWLFSVRNWIQVQWFKYCSRMSCWYICEGGVKHMLPVWKR